MGTKFNSQKVSMTIVWKWLTKIRKKMNNGMDQKVANQKKINHRIILTDYDLFLLIGTSCILFASLFLL